MLHNMHVCGWRTVRAGAETVQVTQQLLDWLAELYAAVGQLDPRWDVVPCLECAGWTAGGSITAPACSSTGLQAGHIKRVPAAVGAD